MKFKILLLAILLLAACSPLRRAQRNQKADSTATDRSEIRKAVTDILRESGTFSQTVVEFYPPAVVTLDTQVQIPSGPEAMEPITPAHAPVPAVKRIVRTDVTASKEQTTTTDSVARNDISVHVKSDTSDKVIEKPPAGVSAIKWIAVGLVALLLLLLLIKFRIFR